MDQDDQRPETKSAGDRPPPRPPILTAVGLVPDGDDSNKNFAITITRAAEGDGKFIRKTGGMGQYGHVKVKIEPNGRDSGAEIINEASRSAIPTEYVEAATAGTREALAGYEDADVVQLPTVDIIVRIVDGSFDENDSSDLAFKMAGIFAVKEAIKKADPIMIKWKKPKVAPPEPVRPARVGHRASVVVDPHLIDVPSIKKQTVLKKWWARWLELLARKS